MDIKTAAIQVLQQAGTALHAKDIAEQIMAAGLWQSGGKAPEATCTIRARHIVTDHGWEISLDSGLDIFQRCEMNDASTFANRLQ